jgi:hypothetical protein
MSPKQLDRPREHRERLAAGPAPAVFPRANGPAGGAVVEQPDGPFIVDVGVARSTVNGALDARFGSGGVRIAVLVVLVVAAALVGSAVAVGTTGAAGWTGSSQQRWVITDLGTLPGTEGLGARRAVRATHAVVWESGKMRDLGTLGGREGIAAAINNHGQIVGTSTTVKGKRHLVLWTLKGEN